MREMKLNRSKKLNKIIVTAIKRSGLPQLELAKKINCHPTYINKIVRQGFVPAPRMLTLLANKLGLDAEKLVRISVGLDRKLDKLNIDADEGFLLKKFRSLSKERKNMFLSMLKGL